jgi:hypothetical protein
MTRSLSSETASSPLAGERVPSTTTWEPVAQLR